MRRSRTEYYKLLEEGKKKCSSCNEIKELDGNFYYKRSADKYESKCNDCMVHYRRKLKPLTKKMEIRYSLHEQQLKKCPGCETIKPYSDYGVNKKAFGGIMAICKICKSESDKKYRENPLHRQKNLDRKKDYYERTKHTERHKENERRHRERRDYKVEYERNRSDEFRRFRQSLRQLTNVHLKKRKDWVKKDSKTNDLLGADYFVVKEFIGRQFLKGMTWDNHGKVWHIDHVIPLDAAGKDPDKLKRLCYYENLSPMWKTDNLRKGYKVPDVCTLWENPIVPYKVNDLVIVPEHNGIVGRYKLQIEPGTKYGMLTVLSDGKTREYKNRYDLRTMTCECECGVIKDIPLNTLRLGTTRSCGCLQRKATSEYMIMNRKMNFTNEELMELVDYVKEHPKGHRLNDDIIQRYEGRTKEQIQHTIRSIRNGRIKKLDILLNNSTVEETI
jgi:hypothetical protein